MVVNLGGMSAEGPQPTDGHYEKVRRTRSSVAWVGAIAGAIVLIIFIIFVAQNSKAITIHFLGASGQLSVAVALLIAAVCGALLVAIPGTARVIQLRRALKKSSQESPARPPS